MLRLLAQREQGYEDIAALMGLSVEEVRTRVKEALAELEESGAGEAAQAPPPPAQAPPAEPVAEAPSEPEPKPAAPEPKAEEAPAPEPKDAPAPKADPPPKPAAPKAKPAAAASGGSRSIKAALPKDKGAMRGLAAGVAVVLVLVVLLVSGVFGGSDDSGSETTSAETAANPAETTNTGSETSGSPEATQAFLKPVDGGDASGRAVFGRSGQDVVLLVKAEGLDPSPQGQSYTVSLARTSGQRLPLIATKENKSGEVLGRFQVAPQILGLLASGFDQMELSLVPDDELATALNAAKKSKSAPTYGGTTVLQGTVTGPIVSAGG